MIQTSVQVQFRPKKNMVVSVVSMKTPAQICAFFTPLHNRYFEYSEINIWSEFLIFGTAILM